MKAFTDGFFAVDEDWRFTYVNRHGESLLRRNREHLIEKRVWDEFPAAVELEFYDPYNRAVETQEDVRFTAFFPPLDTWFEVHAFPFASGLSVYFDDVTERWGQRKKLQVFSEATEHISEAIVITRAKPIDAFTQESSGNARDFEGSGLGLTITDHLIQLMGGSVDVESEKGMGTTF